jgi:hypothetical protein
MPLVLALATLVDVLVLLKTIVVSKENAVALVHVPNPA